MIRFLLVLFLVFALVRPAESQTRGDVRVMFYNAENLFDIQDDPNTSDSDFTPSGIYHWTKEKYDKKLLNIYKVIAGVGSWQPPEIIGIAEVENRQVLQDLITETPLSKFNYSISHFDSPDTRGIDVALLFCSEKLTLLQQEPIFINFTDEPRRKTRNILLVKLLYKTADTLYVFVNHWPSRRGGEIETEALRIQVANILRQRIDQILKSNSQAKIVAIGDFNDEPSNESIENYLKAKPVTGAIAPSQLYNLSYSILQTSHIGTHNFRGQWAVLDQIIVSGNVLLAKRGLFTKSTDVHIFSPEFILQPDKVNMGVKPLPTYAGRKYLGGYSDHLPVYLDLYLKK
jgi:endonuclease/exonuclease/phosphatase family metal-dependent hydrolase